MKVEGYEDMTEEEYKAELRAEFIRQCPGIDKEILEVEVEATYDEEVKYAKGGVMCSPKEAASEELSCWEDQ